MKLGMQEIAFIVVGLIVLGAFVWVAAKIKKNAASNNTTTKQP